MKPIACALFVAALGAAPLPANAHGGEDHAPAAPQAAAGMPAEPRIEAATPDLALLGVLRGDRLVVYLDRHATNEPVPDARIEVEDGGRKAVAAVTEPGTYEARADWLATPGSHALVFTVEAGGIADLLTGKLEVPAPAPPPAKGGPGWLPWAAGAAAVLAALAGLLALRPRGAAALALLAAMAGSPPDATAHGGEDHAREPAGPKAPRGTPAPAAPIPAGSAPVRLPDGAVFMPKPAQRALSIRTAVAEETEAPVTAQLLGHVIADPNASGRVQSTQPGRIAPGPKGLPHLGQRVRQGETLAWLVPATGSLEQGSRQAELADLRAQLDVARARAARLEQLEGSVARREIEGARSEAGALEKRIAALSGALGAREALAAPVSGVVSDVRVAAGQVVEPRETLFEIVDPARLWVQAVAYDSALARSVTGASGVTNSGTALRLAWLGSGYDVKEQAIPVQFRVEAPVPAVTVGEKVKLTVRTRERVRGILVPQSSLVRDARGEEVLWVHTAAERFEPRRATAQAVDAASSVVTGGLATGDRYVTQGAALLSQVR